MWTLKFFWGGGRKILQESQGVCHVKLTPNNLISMISKGDSSWKVVSMKACKGMKVQWGSWALENVIKLPSAKVDIKLIWSVWKNSNKS